MKIRDDEIGIYVALDSDGKVVQYFTDAEKAWDTETHIDDSIVSVGYVLASPHDYDELFNTDEDGEHVELLPGLTITEV